jgi:hypothetical protein
MPIGSCTHPDNGARCAACQLCAIHCTCPSCRACNFRFLPEEICPRCKNCAESCCGCKPCSGNCGKMLAQIRDNITQCRNCLKCMDCCSCWICRKCKVSFRERLTDFCNNCNRCHEHCEDYTCYGSGEDTSHSCNIVGYCNECRTCPKHCRCAKCPLCNKVTHGVRANDPRMVNQYFHTTRGISENAPEPCGGCKKCCRCKVVGVEHRKGEFTMYHSVYSKGQFKRNSLRRHLSVELEVDRLNGRMYSGNVNKALDKWKDPVVSDGSLTNDESQSFEINTNPSNGDLFLDHIKELCDGLAEVQARCTTACGLHVHINVKGTPLVKEDGTAITRNGEMVYDHRSAYTHYDLRRLILLYYFIEPAVYGLCAPARLTSRYAKPCGSFYLTKNSDPKNFRKDIAVKMYRGGEAFPKGFDPNAPRPKVKKVKQVINYDRDGEPVYGWVSPKVKSEFRRIGQSINSTKKEKYHKIRYNSLNLHSFFMRGTVEFRHKEGTVSYDEITNWALVCGHIVDAAARMTEAQIRELPKNPRQALLAILPLDLQQYCERKWAVQDAEQPRFQQMIDEQWRGQITYEV